MAQRPPFAPGSTNTGLDLLTEAMFRKWVADNRVPFNPSAPASDYDMRGFYQALQQGNPMATASINPNDGRMHYPDYWKNPVHETFSDQSQFAGPDAPSWINGSQLAAPSGRILYDEKNPPVTMGSILCTR